MIIKPAKFLRGTISLPGDKSISHRAAMIAAMASGESRIENYAASADCASTLACLDALGVQIDRNGSEIIIKGVGKNGFKPPDKPLDCGNSGTTMRLISGIMAGQGFDSVLTGDDSLSSRPMKRVIEPLSAMNARIESSDGKAPLHIFGRNSLTAYDHEMQVSSAQVKSCILLAGLNADGITSVIEKTPTRNHTEQMLRFFGADLTTESINTGTKISVSGDSNLTAKDMSVPSDISSAAFFIVAAACLKGSELRIENVGLNPTRTAVIDALRRFGANIEISEVTINGGEPAGSLNVRGISEAERSQASNRLDGKIIANLIDEIPVLAVFGTQMRGGLEVHDAAELRVKESDRISAVVENLRRMGAAVEEFPDGFRVEQSRLKGAPVDSFGDHRIAMAFAIAALFAEGETEISGSECASVSFPNFYEVLASVAN